MSVKDILDRLTIDEIKSNAGVLEKLGLENKPYHKIVSSANKLLDGHIEWAGNYHIDDLYRGRLWNKEEPPAHVNELLALPANKVTGYGRLHVPGQSVLYTSEMTQTVFNELSVKSGEEVVMLRLIRTQSDNGFYISRLGMLPSNTLNDNEKIINISVGGDNNYKKLLEIRKQVNAFFKKQISEKIIHQYKITAALGSNHFDKNTIKGVMYPSVTTKYATVNLAIKPEVVGDIFEPHSVAWFKVRSRDWDEHHVFTKKTARIDKEGNLIWDDSLTFQAPMHLDSTFLQTD